MSEKGKTPKTGETEEILTIESAAKELGLTEFRVRSAIRKGDLKTYLVPIKDGSKTNRHEFTRADMLEWRNATGSHTRRADGRNKYNIYMTADEYEKVMTVLADAKLETPIVRANVHKAEVEIEIAAE